METKNRGRPPKIKTKKAMQKLIDAYFEECEGVVLQDDDGRPMLDKRGRFIRADAKPPTITGLALALGLSGRQALLNYQDKEEFMDTIMRAKSRVEQYAEERLFDKDGANGAKFSLANNFEGWKESRQVDGNLCVKTKLEDLI